MVSPRTREDAQRSELLRRLRTTILDAQRAAMAGQISVGELRHRLRAADQEARSVMHGLRGDILAIWEKHHAMGLKVLRQLETQQHASEDDSGTLTEVPVFAAGTFATKVDPDTHEVLATTTYTQDDLDQMAANGQHLDATGQDVPIVEEHDGKERLGGLRNLRRIGQKLYGDLVDLRDDFAAAFKANKLLGRSVEVTPNGAAWNYCGTDGHTVKRLALLTENLPRIKTLDSPVYSDAFAEPADGGGHAVHFQEGAMPDDILPDAAAGGGEPTVSITVGGILDFLKANPDKVDDLKAALGMNAEEPEVKPEDEAQEPDPEKEEQEMSEDAALLRARAESAEAAVKRLMERDRGKAIDEFYSEARRRYGKARADEARALVERRAASIDVLEQFSEAGEDRLAALFGETFELMGPRTIHTTPLAEGQPQTVGGEAEFSEDKAKQDIFSEMDQATVRWMQATPDGRETLAKMIENRKAAHGRKET